MRAPGTLTTFLEHVAIGYPLFATPDAVARIVAEAVEDAAADGTRYLELRFGPATHTAGGMRLDDVVGAAAEGIRDGVRASGIDAGLVVCALRQHDEETNRAVARAAASFAGLGVVGFDVAGDELVFPDLAPMREAFGIARAAGLGLTAHAAEAGPASAVRDALELLGVRRIGHGSRAAEDAGLLAWAAGEGICFEVCPTSNVLTGAAASYESHPARAFVAAGCDVVVGDDDPTTIGGRLSRELDLLERAVGLTSADMERVGATSIERVFCEESVRARLRAGG
jgi:adenosine deaminase